MEENKNKMEENKNKVTEEVQEGGVGRLNSASQQEEGQRFGSKSVEGQIGKQVRDISDIDQQEGNLNNGTLGGNFDEPEEGNEHRNK